MGVGKPGGSNLKLNPVGLKYFRTRTLLRRSSSLEDHRVLPSCDVRGAAFQATEMFESDESSKKPAEVLGTVQSPTIVPSFQVLIVDKESIAPENVLAILDLREHGGVEIRPVERDIDVAAGAENALEFSD
jgi:hypothetical protein